MADELPGGSPPPAAAPPPPAAAPPAAAPPAAAPPPVVTQEAQGSVIDRLSAKTAELRKELATTGKLTVELPAEGTPAAADSPLAQARRAQAAAQERAPDGTFKEGEDGTATGEGAADAGGSPDEGDGTESDASSDATGAESEIPAGEGAPVEAALGEGEVKVLIPGRQIGEQFEMVVGDPETAERIRQLTNGYMRGETIRQERAVLDARAAEHNYIDTHLTEDPVGFLVKHIPQAGRELVVRALLTEPGMVEAIQADLDRYKENPSEARADNLAIQRASDDKEKDISSRINQRAAGLAIADVARDVVEQLAVEVLERSKDGVLASRFTDDALRDIRDGILNPALKQELETRGLTPERARQILKDTGRLTLYRLDGERKPDTNGTGKPKDPPTTRTAKPTEAAAAKLSEQRVRTARAAGTAMRQAAAARTAIGKVPSAGVAPVASAPAMPKTGNVHKITDSIRVAMGMRPKHGKL